MTAFVICVGLSLLSKTVDVTIVKNNPVHDYFHSSIICKPQHWLLLLFIPGIEYNANNIIIGILSIKNVNCSGVSDKTMTKGFFECVKASSNSLEHAFDRSHE